MVSDMDWEMGSVKEREREKGVAKACLLACMHAGSIACTAMKEEMRSVCA